MIQCFQKMDQFSFTFLVNLLDIVNIKFVMVNRYIIYVRPAQVKLWSLESFSHSISSYFIAKSLNASTLSLFKFSLLLTIFV